MAPAGSSATDRAPGTPAATAADSAAADGALTEKETTNTLDAPSCKLRCASAEWAAAPAAASSAAGCSARAGAAVGQSFARTTSGGKKPLMSVGLTASDTDMSVALTLKSADAGDALAQARNTDSICASGVLGASTAADSAAYGKPLNCSDSENDAEPVGGTYAASTAEAATPDGSGVALGVGVASGVCDGLGSAPCDSDAAPVALAYTLGVVDALAPRDTLAVLGGEALGEAPDGAVLMETAVDESGATEPAAVDGEKMEGVATAAEAVTAALTDEETPCVLEAVGI